MTGARNGTISLWKDKTVEKSAKLFSEWTLVLYKNDRIFAASRNNVIELNMNLDVVKKFKGRDSQPYTIDANEKYLVVGYGSGFVDVHSKKDRYQNGVYQIVMVSEVLT